MWPIGPLMREHRLIERMLKVVERRLEEMRRDRRADPVFIETVVAFVRSYADRCHHGKEEDILFRDLAARDLAPDLRRIMEELLREHMEGRAMVRELEDANRLHKQGDPHALDAIIQILRQLASFYPRHIEKEDKQFFYPCMELFSKREKDAMLEEFWDFDRRLIHEQNEKLVVDLEDRNLVAS